MIKYIYVQYGLYENVFSFGTLQKCCTKGTQRYKSTRSKKIYTWMSGFIQISSNFKNVKKKEKLPRNSIVTTGRSWGKFSPITLYGTSRRFKRDVTQFFQSRRISLRLVNNIFKSYVVYEPPITFKSTVFPMHHPSSMRT